MIEIARRWRVLAAGVAAGVAGVVWPRRGHRLGRSPCSRSRRCPPSVTATQPTSPDAALAAPQSLSQPSVTSATQPAAAAPGGLATPTPDAAAPRRRRPTIVPASSGTLTDFFHEKGVTLEPQTAARLQGPQHRAAGAEGLGAGARPQRSRRVRGDRRPRRRQRPLLVERPGRGLQAGRRIRSEGGHQPRVRRQPAVAGLAGHRWVARPTSAACRPRSSRAPTGRTR